MLQQGYGGEVLFDRYPNLFPNCHAFVVTCFYCLDGDLRLCTQGIGQDQSGPTEGRHPGHKLFAILTHTFTVHNGHQRVRYAFRH